MRDKSEIVLRTLLSGRDVSLSGYICRYDPDTSQVVIVGTRITDDCKEEIYLDCDMYLNQFLTFARSISDDEIALMCANLALTDTKKRR